MHKERDLWSEERRDVGLPEPYPNKSSLFLRAWWSEHSEKTDFRANILYWSCALRITPSTFGLPPLFQLRKLQRRVSLPSRYQ